MTFKDRLLSMIQSRKFMYAVVGVIQSVVLEYLAVPDALWQSIDVLIAVIILSIGIEDAGAKSAPVQHTILPPPGEPEE